MKFKPIKLLKNLDLAMKSYVIWGSGKGFISDFLEQIKNIEKLEVKNLKPIPNEYVELRKPEEQRCWEKIRKENPNYMGIETFY